MKTTYYIQMHRGFSIYNTIDFSLNKIHFNQTGKSIKKWLKHKIIAASGIFFSKKSYNIPDLFVTSRSKSNSINQVLIQFSIIQPLNCDYKILTSLLNIIKSVCVLITDFFTSRTKVANQCKRVI